ncbi:hypothetical protein RJ40_08400 [Methanofollis aquaemaris]|uniref:Uncharacterized protein n=1 Tax=Methanofollis aquaemaris TaxID=126734 RepID=A0A8A3S710_9EURY|nr:hypothetical protein [Methanofollis aquaemaris]QSZ67521.1 hypothetical protein RJ40_08400 [Methanofollis aquaemaris]
MVDDSAQLYTIEGFAAAFIILATAYLVGGTTSIYTPGDSHITDMQLEQIGSDVLAVMDTPTTQGADSELVGYVQNWNRAGFNASFWNLLNNRASGTDMLEYEASISYRNAAANTVQNTNFTFSQQPTGYEQAVRVTRLVTVPEDSSRPDGCPLEDHKQVVLLEVLLWRS